MTFSSCWLEEIEPKTVPDYGTPPPRKIADLPTPSNGSGHYWLPVVKAWAGPRPIEYVDNAWIRVKASPDELRAFLQSVYGDGGKYFQALNARIRNEAYYVIVAEEF